MLARPSCFIYNKYRIINMKVRRLVWLVIPLILLVIPLSMKSDPPPPTPLAPGRAWTEPVTGMEFVWVPAGCAKLDWRADRAGTSTSWYWGEDKDKICEFANVHDVSGKKTYRYDWRSLPCNDGYPGTSPVGSFPPNGFGLYDMLGNVAEWCLENHVFLDEWTDPPTPKEYNMVRGGSWVNDFDDANVFSRGYYDPHDIYDTMGFRLVIEPDQNPQ